MLAKKEIIKIIVKGEKLYIGIPKNITYYNKLP